jgi:chemotaxis protein histidine kinase CheA
VRDRRLLNDAKENARRAYHESYTRARNGSPAHDVQGVAGDWLREINRLNRQLELADKRAEEVTRQIAELEGSLPAIELAADAARIASEAAQVASVEARRALAACEENAARQTQTRPATAATAAPATAATATVAPVAAPPRHTGPAPISQLLRGDRQALLGLTLRLAEETGVEAGRLQLLLLELRQAIAARALEDGALAFPAGHPFWSQFTVEQDRQLVVSLARAGYAFDGHDGWRDARVPGARELAMALEHAGHDPRSLRRPAGQEAIDGLWQGTRVLVEEWLAAAAPDLALGRMIDILGPRGARLGELWDMWGRLRLLLLPAAN